MIKMDYGSDSHKKALEETFMGLLDNVDVRQKRWRKLRKELYTRDAEFKTILPTDMKKMMVMQFTDLAIIYERYIALGFNKTTPLHLSLQALFIYEKTKGSPFNALRPSFIDFFKEEKNGLKIHTCHYCDMSYINYFKYENGKRTQFDLDHVLDKGRCPLVALSLYNLVPACPTCNGPHIKGKRVIDVTLAQRQKLSPSSPLYDFDNKVKIWIRPINGKVHNTCMLKHQEDYELEFDTLADKDYDKEIEFFFLRQRYNCHKCEALRLADLKAKYSRSKIIEIAKIICGVGKGRQRGLTLTDYRMINQIQTDIFGSEFNRENHRAFGKLHKDIMDNQL